jgi:hypothetical protein
MAQATLKNVLLQHQGHSDVHSVIFLSFRHRGEGQQCAEQEMAGPRGRRALEAGSRAAERKSITYALSLYKHLGGWAAQCEMMYGAEGARLPPLSTADPVPRPRRCPATAMVRRGSPNCSGLSSLRLDPGSSSCVSSHSGSATRHKRMRHARYRTSAPQWAATQPGSMQWVQ